MNNIKIELPVIILGTGILFLSGWVINGFVLEPLQSEHIISYGSLVKDKSSTIIDILAYVPIAIVLTILYSRFISSLTLVNGALLGMLTLAMFNLSSNLNVLSEWDLINAFVLITDVVGMAIIGGIGGAVIIISLNKLKK